MYDELKQNYVYTFQIIVKRKKVEHDLECIHIIFVYVNIYNKGRKYFVSFGNIQSVRNIQMYFCRDVPVQKYEHSKSVGTIFQYKILLPPKKWGNGTGPTRSSS